MDKRKMKKLLILNLPYFLVGLFATNLGEAWRLAEGADSSAKILSFFHALPIALNNPFPSFHPLDLLIGILCGAGLEKARKKRAEWDAKVKDLERRYREEENSEIHEMVHAANLNPEQLSELLRMFAADMAPKPDTINTMNEEETQNEI